MVIFLFGITFNVHIIQHRYVECTKLKDTSFFSIFVDSLEVLIEKDNNICQDNQHLHRPEEDIAHVKY